MEELILRFSHLSENIFKSLSNGSIARCTKVSKFWHNYLNNQKFVEIRKIKATVAQFHVIGEAWNEVNDTVSTKTIMDLGQAVQKFYKKGADLTYSEGLTPLHVAAGTGQLTLYQTFREKYHDKQPKDNIGYMPLHYAAQNGHFELCEAILSEGFKDKNPKTNNDWTPLHLAAIHGHTKVYELLSKNVDNKNPDIYGLTPLNLAANRGHAELFEFIMKTLNNKNANDA